VVRGVLFDLDDTLYDHAYSARVALGVLAGAAPALAALGMEELARRYRRALDEVHTFVLSGEMGQEAARLERYRRLFASAGPVPDDAELAGYGAVFRKAYRASQRPVPGALELLSALKGRGIGAVIVSNNLKAEQEGKLRDIGMTALIDHLVVSEEAGFTKPDPGIFRVALERAGLEAGEAVMLGDNREADIEGALGAGIRAVWFNRSGSPASRPGIPVLRSLEPLPAALAILLATR
jgi:putative hydrolase of the HAD superfamily